MCGRVGFFDDIAWSRAVNNYYGRIDNRVGKLTPRYNIAPSQPLATLLNIGTYTFTHFGLIPHWMKERKAVAINARAKTLLQKPSFREPFQHKRCIIPVNGFYEWKKEGSHKVPYWIHPKEGGFFALAGLWDEWKDKETGVSPAGVNLHTGTSGKDGLNPSFSKPAAYIPCQLLSLIHI